MNGTETLEVLRDVNLAGAGRGAAYGDAPGRADVERARCSG